MNSLEETISQLYVLCGVVLISALFLFFLALDFKNKSISLILWFAAFNGLYLGGGALNTLSNASASDLEYLFSLYNISPKTINHAYFPWLIFIVAVLVANILIPSFADISCFKDFFAPKQPVHFRYIIILSLCLIFFWSFKAGGIGYMGQSVGTDKSSYEVSPLFSLLFLGFLVFFPFLFIMLINSKVSLFILTAYALTFLLATALGRRVLHSLLIAPAIVVLVWKPSILRSIKTYLILGVFSLVILFSARFFYALRIISWENSQGGKEISLYSMGPKALKLAFADDKLSTSHFDEERRENEIQRPFGPLGYYIYINDLFKDSTGYRGEVSLGALKSIIPRYFYPKKDEMMESSFEIETFVARFQSLPGSRDEAPTAIVTGLVDFGCYGIVILVFSYSLLLFFMLRLGSYTKNNLLACSICLLNLVQLQWAECNPITILETTRATIMFSFLALSVTWFRRNGHFVYRRA